VPLNEELYVTVEGSKYERGCPRGIAIKRCAGVDAVALVLYD